MVYSALRQKRRVVPTLPKWLKNTLRYESMNQRSRILTTSAPPALTTGLYHLRDDIGERRDLSGTQPAQIQEPQ
jgi:hypothetical protein